METDFQPVVGHKFRFVCSHTTYCEVLEVKPFTKLSYSWQASSTELQLVHNGFTTLEDLLTHQEGWTKTATKLVELLNTIKI